MISSSSGGGGWSPRYLFLGVVGEEVGMDEEVQPIEESFDGSGLEIRSSVVTPVVVRSTASG
jgi:hypothetical protein